MLISHFSGEYEPTVYLCEVIDDFGNQIDVPKSQDIGFRAWPLISALDFYESGEVH